MTKKIKSMKKLLFIIEINAINLIILYEILR